MSLISGDGQAKRTAEDHADILKDLHRLVAAKEREDRAVADLRLMDSETLRWAHELAKDTLNRFYGYALCERNMGLSIRSWSQPFREMVLSAYRTGRSYDQEIVRRTLKIVIEDRPGAAGKEA